MRFFCVTRARLEATNASLRRACAARDIEYVAVAPGAIWLPLAGGPEPGDLVYRAVADAAADRVETLLLSSEVTSFYRNPGFRCVDPLAVFAREGLPVPRTVFNVVAHSKALAASVAALGGFPVVLRPAASDHGQSPVKVETAEDLARLAERHAGPAALQELVDPDRALRLIVVGSRVRAAYATRRGPGELRSDGPGVDAPRATTPPLGAAELTLRAAALLGLELAAVDLLVTHSGDLVLLDVELPFDLAAIERTCDVDIAGAMLDHLVAKTG